MKFLLEKWNGLLVFEVWVEYLSFLVFLVFLVFDLICMSSKISDLYILDLLKLVNLPSTYLILLFVICKLLQSYLITIDKLFDNSLDI